MITLLFLDESAGIRYPHKKGTKIPTHEADLNGVS
jgi:hypothetical protein